MIKSKKGITLVEMIISVSFTLIIITASCMVMLLGKDFFNSGTKNAVNQQNAALAESYLQRYASIAFKLSTKNDKSEDSVVFTISNNILNIKSSDSTVKIDDIGKLKLKIEDKLLRYTIVSADNTYKLSGAIIMNNFDTGKVQDLNGNKERLVLMKLLQDDDIS